MQLSQSNSVSQSCWWATKSNIRSNIFGDDDEESLPLATPNFNAGVLFDLTMQKNQQLLHGIFDERKIFQEGLVLLKVWLRQREFDLCYNGFSPQLLAMFLAFLYKQRKLHANMSSYQVACTAWNQLAYSAWDEDGKGISLSDNSTDLPNQSTLEQFHTYYEVVLQHHFQLEDRDFDYIAGELDISYRLAPVFKTDRMSEKFKVPQDVDAEGTSLNVIRSFDDLACKLHALNELTLDIVSIAGISPVFRYCEPIPILPQARMIGEQMYAIHVHHGIIQLGKNK